MLHGRTVSCLPIQQARRKSAGSFTRQWLVGSHLMPYLVALGAVCPMCCCETGWTVLHCLANAAAKAADAGAEGEQRVALLMQLMKEYVQRVQAVSGQLGSAAIIRAEEAAAMLEDQCLHSAEPGRHYQGQQYMSMLQL